MKFVRENFIWILLGLIIFILASIRVVAILTPTKETKTTQETSKSSTEQTTSFSAEEETTDQKNYRKAKLKLEHPYTEASEEAKQQVAVAVTAAVESIQKAEKLPEVKATYENHLFMTQGAMVQTFGMAFLVNGYQYDPSQLEVLKSDADDVVQFLLVLKKEGEENCYFIGNYNTTVQQLQLDQYVGGNIGATYG